MAASVEHDQRPDGSPSPPAEQRSPGKPRFRRWAWPLALTTLAVTGLLGWAYAHFGSLELAARYLNGQRVIARPIDLPFGKGKVGELREFTVSLTNLGKTDVIVIGGSVDCSCLGVDRFPLAVRPGETFPLTIKAGLGPRAGDYDHIVTYYTDSHDLPVFQVRVHGQIVE